MGIQVTELTQGKKPWEKEFVDFEFNGKHVSEFGLVVAFGGDRLSLTAFPEFEDETSEINGATGQLYWGTRFKTIERTYTLVTDGITEEQINAFRTHFTPGKYGKFVEDHLIHRYSYCRVSKIENFEMIPFRKKVEIMGYEFLTNEYKGEIQITFTWDEPFFYAEENYITEALTKENAAELIRVTYNNKTPHINSWSGIVFEQDAVMRESITECCLGADKKISKSGSLLGYLVLGESRIGASFMEDSGYDATSLIAYYNPSSLEKSPYLSLTYTPTVTEVNASDWKPVYFSNIADDINIGGPHSYNSIEIAKSPILTSGELLTYPKNEEFTTVFKYTTPNVIRSIHRAIQIAWDMYNKNSVVALIDLEERLREEITHNKVMNWLAETLEYLSKSPYVNEGKLIKETTIKDFAMPLLGINKDSAVNWFVRFNALALYFFCGKETIQSLVGDEAFLPYEIIFDGDTNSAKIKFNDVEENCGDMVCSPYLKLAGGDKIDLNGKIETCHYLRFRKANALYPVNATSDCVVKLQYKYCYM